MIALLLLLSLNPLVTPGVVRQMSTEQVCTTIWSKDARHVTTKMKRDVLRNYGIDWADRNKYRFDHLIPRQLGGADAVGNLWPEPKDDARKKDVLERHLHREVCAGRMTLDAAQAVMRAWR